MIQCFARFQWVRKAFRGLPNGFITQQALRDPLFIADLSRQGQRPHARGLAIECAAIDARYAGGVHSGRRPASGATLLGRFDCLATALHALGVKGVDDIADSLDRTAHQLGNGLGRLAAGHLRGRSAPGGHGRHPRLRRSASNCSTLLIGQGSNKERWFHSPSIPREAPLHKNSCGDALGHGGKAIQGRGGSSISLL